MARFESPPLPLAGLFLPVGYQRLSQIAHKVQHSSPSSRCSALPCPVAVLTPPSPSTLYLLFSSNEQKEQHMYRYKQNEKGGDMKSALECSTLLLSRKDKVKPPLG